MFDKVEVMVIARKELASMYMFVLLYIPFDTSGALCVCELKLDHALLYVIPNMPETVKH